MASEPETLKLKIASPTQLAIEDGVGRAFGIHPIWLRERCQDAQSMDLLTGQRLHDPSDLDLGLTLTAVSEAGPGRLHIRFSDGHEAEFLARDILAEAALPPGEHDVPALATWTGALEDLPRAAWQAAARRCRTLTAWLALPSCAMGSSYSAACPPNITRCSRRPRVFGFTRDTNFGTVFDVRSVPNATDLAYTAVQLGPAYRQSLPLARARRCSCCTAWRTRPRAGLSTLVDGYAVG